MELFYCSYYSATQSVLIFLRLYWSDSYIIFIACCTDYSTAPTILLVEHFYCSYCFAALSVLLFFLFSWPDYSTVYIVQLPRLLCSWCSIGQIHFQFLLFCCPNSSAVLVVGVFCCSYGSAQTELFLLFYLLNYSTVLTVLLVTLFYCY